MKRTISRWLQRNFMVASDDLVAAILAAWWSIKVSDRRDNSGATCQRMHREAMQELYSKLAARR